MLIPRLFATSQNLKRLQSGVIADPSRPSNPPLSAFDLLLLAALLAFLPCLLPHPTSPLSKIPLVSLSSALLFGNSRTSNTIVSES